MLFLGKIVLGNYHLKVLVQSGVPFFAKALSRFEYIGSWEYESMLKYVKFLFKDEFYSDTAKQLIDLDEFKTKDLKKMCNAVEKSILQRLIIDLKTDFSHHQYYIDLVRVQTENLNSLRVNGCPKFSWQQPTCRWIKEEIQDFLAGSEVTHVIADEFANKEISRSWIKRYARTNLEEGYSFSAVAMQSENGKIKIVLQKERHVYENERNGYMRLMNELKDLETFLPSPKLMPTGVKRKLMTTGIKRKYNLRERRKK